MEHGVSTPIAVFEQEPEEHERLYVTSATLKLNDEYAGEVTVSHFMRNDDGTHSTTPEEVLGEISGCERVTLDQT